MRVLRAQIAVALLLLASSPLTADAPVPEGAELEASGARIGKVLISRKNIFDPSDPHESYWPYRFANKLHVVTREDVIRRELLFREGDLYRQAIIEESERNLRALGVIYHVHIRPVDYHDGLVDLEVTSQDTWTLRPSVRFSRAGGDNATGFSFSEQNFLGRLKLFQISRRSNVDRTTTQLLYSDPRFFGSRYAFKSSYARSSDGTSWGLSFERPFFSLDTPWNMGAGGGKLEQVSKIYQDGDVVFEFHQETDSFNVSYGISTGLVGSHVVRSTFGYSYLRNVFFQEPDQEGFGLQAVPPDQKFSGPVFTLESLSAHYVKVRNYNQFDRDEDYNLGHDMNLSLWLSLKDFEADKSQVIVNLGDSVGIPVSTQANLFQSFLLSGRLGSGDAENVIVTEVLESYCRFTPRQTFYARLGIDVGYNLDPQNQLLLGGDTGLRGYPTRQFDGDRRLLLSLEHRFFSDLEIFRLVRLGFAGFADVGDAWYQGGESLSDLHSDFGLGLRFAVVRSSVATVSRLDLAYSVDAEQTDSPRFQVLFGTALRF